MQGFLRKLMIFDKTKLKIIGKCGIDAPLFGIFIFYHYNTNFPFVKGREAVFFGGGGNVILQLTAKMRKKRQKIAYL